MVVHLEEILRPDSQLFAKSEFAPANSEWPGLSFSSKKIAGDLQKSVLKGKDFIIYVGTSNPNDTPEIGHRQRLLSVVDVEPRALVSTKDIVSADAWARAKKQYPDRWDFSVVIARAWTIIGFPKAHDVLPETYAAFSNPGTRGHVIPVADIDLRRLMSLELEEIDLSLTGRALSALSLNTDNRTLKKELSRLMNAIQSDISRSQEESRGHYPLRRGPNSSDIYKALLDCWNKQKGRCALCGVAIPIVTQNKLLQMSRDRIDSSEKTYDSRNLQITHLGCNLAKSDATLAEWREFYEMFRNSAHVVLGDVPDSAD